MENEKTTQEDNSSSEDDEKIKSYFFFYPIALFLVFEEWGWAYLAEQIDKFGRLISWKKIEAKITHLSPKLSALVLLIPFFLLLPLKFFGVFLFNGGHIAMGTTLVIASKIFGTAFFSRIFQLTRPKLMHFNWFAKYYPRWKKWKDRLLRKVRKSVPWKVGHRIKERIKKFALSLVNLRRR